MAYSLAQVITEVRRLLNESVAAFYSDAEIQEWIVQGTLDVSTVAKCVEGRTEIAAVIGTWFYALPTDTVEVLHVVWDDTKQGLRKIVGSMVGEAGPAVDGVRPQTWFEWGGSLYINPIPDASATGKNLAVFYARSVTDVTALAASYQWLVITFATYRGKLKDKRLAEATVLYADYGNALAFRRLDIHQRLAHTEADVQLAAQTVTGGQRG